MLENIDDHLDGDAKGEKHRDTVGGIDSVFSGLHGSQSEPELGWVSSRFSQEHASRWCRIISMCELLACVHGVCWKKTVLIKGGRDAPGFQMSERSIICRLLPVREMNIGPTIEVRQNGCS